MATRHEKSRDLKPDTPVSQPSLLRRLNFRPRIRLIAVLVLLLVSAQFLKWESCKSLYQSIYIAWSTPVVFPPQLVAHEPIENTLPQFESLENPTSNQHRPPKDAMNSTPFNAHEIASLMEEWYRLLIKMQYYPESHLKLPPHDPPINRSLAEQLGMDPNVVELLELLPYMENTHGGEFIHYGQFADFRGEDDLRQSRDPTFASPEGGFDEPNGEYMRPWVMALNDCGNHGVILFLDTKRSESTCIMY
jgi:hypothetical protein